MRAPDVVIVPGGRYRMGSDRGREDETPVHLVELPAFGVGRTAVTNAEYAAFLAATGAPPPPWWAEPAFSHPAQPAVGVSWFDARDYARWLSRHSGRRWRLPTEAEWERAARGGLDGAATAWGDTLPAGEIPEAALEAPWPVGKGTPNGFGLLDPGTIVHEWCSDWYDPAYYGRSARLRPRGPQHGTRRSSRGGSWRHRVRWSAPGARSSLPPGFRYSDYGFRLVCELS